MARIAGASMFRSQTLTVMLAKQTPEDLAVLADLLASGAQGLDPVTEVCLRRVDLNGQVAVEAGVRIGVELHAANDAGLSIPDAESASAAISCFAPAVSSLNSRRWSR